MPTPKKKSVPLRRERITFDQALALLNISKTTFYRMIERGEMPRSDDGEYVLGEVLDAYIEHLFSEKGLKEAQTQLIRAKAKREERALAEEEGELFRGEAIKKVYTEDVINCKTKLLTIPNKIAPQLVGQDLQTIIYKLNQEIKQTLRELAEFDEDRLRRINGCLVASSRS